MPLFVDRSESLCLTDDATIFFFLMKRHQQIITCGLTITIAAAVVSSITLEIKIMQIFYFVCPYFFSHTSSLPQTYIKWKKLSSHQIKPIIIIKLHDFFVRSHTTQLILIVFMHENIKRSVIQLLSFSLLAIVSM